ncbi:MAG: hypothetical protein LBQ33_05405 [Oscillospiraceae bacterium]|nr:hypothetical protein [Oscillospiraceae bacterium]
MKVYSDAVLPSTPIDLYAELDSSLSGTLDSIHFTNNGQAPVRRTIIVNLNPGERVSLRMYDPAYPNPSPSDFPDIETTGQVISFEKLS